MRPPLSIRGRLFATLIITLALAALLVSGVRFLMARDLANRIYDSTLEVVALTISRDVVLSEGDLLAEELLSRLIDTLGDPFYYRVTGPGGRFITGYSEGPEGSPAWQGDLTPGRPVFYDGTYFDRQVRGVVLREFLGEQDFNGWTTVEVWQTVEERRELSLRLLGQTIAIFVITFGIVSLSLYVAIEIGLKPLRALSEAVGRRSPQELPPLDADRLPEELVPLATATNGLIAEIRQALARRDSFLSDAAHQLRNPIAAVSALLDVARKTQEEAALRAVVEEAHQGMLRIRRLAQQLLSLETLDGRLAAAPPMRIDLVELVSERTAAAAPAILDAGSEIEFEAPERWPGADVVIPVLADPGLLGEAIENLIDNARLYGLSRGGLLRIRVTALGGAACVTVADDGPGIPPELAGRVFERFIRGGEDGHRGSGLGLAIARRIATRFGGSLELVPSEQGACFLLCLPLADPDPGS